MKLISLILTLSIALLTGCATTVKMQVKRAPAINLEDTKTIAIDPFSVTGNLDLDLVDSKNNLLGVVTNIAVSVGSNKLAEAQHDDIQTAHRDGLRNAIFNNGHFQVSSGNNIQATLAGNINYDVVDKLDKNETKDKQGNVVVSYTLNRTAKVSVQMNVNDKKGTMIGSTTLTASSKKQSYGVSKKEARNRTEDWSKLVKKAVKSLHNSTVRKIAPYYVWESRTLAEGDLKIIEKGNDAADDGNWPQAVSMWNEALSAGKTKDKAAALHNLAIYDETQGKLQDSLKKLEEANSMVDESDYAKQLNVIKRRIHEAELLKGS